MQVKFIQFADIKVPKLIESRGELSIMRFGEKNLFPNELLQMFNKSAKHNAIILGKVNYIMGQGFGETKSKPNPLETWDELGKKSSLDIEINGGCYLEAHWNAEKKVGAWYLVPYHKVRSNKDNTQFTVKDWTSLSRNEPKEIIPAFNPNVPEGKQILFYKEYRPGFETYTLPGYLGSLNYIQTDIEISKYHLSTITNGMFASKMINFFQGLPTEDEQKDIDKGLKNKFTGAENAGSIMVTYNDDPAKAPTVLDLSATDLDKHFDILNKTVQQEIFAGHQITSPMLFGIKTEGQLGGRTEMREAYEIFKSTYCNDKQQNIERLFTEMVGYMGKNQEMKITAVEPIGIDFSEAIYKEFAPREWIIEKMGIDLTKYPSTAPQVNPDGTVVEDMVNDNLKNLTGRQQQQLLRIVRLFSKGQLTKAQAAMQLKAFGLTDQQVNDYLGLDDDPLTDDAKFSSQDEDDRMFIEFSNHGEDRSKFDIIKKRKVFSFADEMVTELEAEVLDLIKKDKRITAEVIAETLKMEPGAVNKVIDKLEQDGRLTAKAKRIGKDVIIERTLTEPLSKITDEKPRTSTFKIMYGYEGPQDSRNRPFCARMMELNRLYTRAEIETISRRLGYSVFDRRGGWYHNPSTNTTTPYCRHTWTSFVTIKRT